MTTLASTFKGINRFDGKASAAIIDAASEIELPDLERRVMVIVDTVEKSWMYASIPVIYLGDFVQQLAMNEDVTKVSSGSTIKDDPDNIVLYEVPTPRPTINWDAVARIKKSAS